MSFSKHFIILAILLLAFGQAVRSQSTAVRPYEGALQTYTCNGISVGASYECYITANANGTGRYDDGLTSDGLAYTPIYRNAFTSSHIIYK